jgi:hypothetical protein
MAGRLQLKDEVSMRVFIQITTTEMLRNAIYDIRILFLNYKFQIQIHCIRSSGLQQFIVNTEGMNHSDIS